MRWLPGRMVAAAAGFGAGAGAAAGVDIVADAAPTVTNGVIAAIVLAGTPAFERSATPV